MALKKQVFVKKYSGEYWEQIGFPIESPHYASDYVSIKTDSKENIFLLIGGAGFVYIYKFDGKQWLAWAGGQSANLFQPTLVIDNNDVPYVMSGYYNTVYYSDALSWYEFSAIPPDQKVLNLAVHPITNKLYLASMRYENNTPNIVVSIMNNDDSFEEVTKFSIGYGYDYNSLECSFNLDNDGKPTLAYPDNTSNGKLSVIRYNDGAWQPIGSLGNSY